MRPALPLTTVTMFNKLVRESSDLWIWKRSPLSWLTPWSTLVLVCFYSRRLWMWNVGIPVCQSQVQRRIWVSALDRASSRRSGRRPVHAKSHWRTFSFLTSLRPVHVILSFTWHLLALKELPLLGRLRLMQPVSLEPLQADRLKWAALGSAADIRCFPVCGRSEKRWCFRVISYTQSSAEWLLVLGGNRPWVSDFQFLFATARVHINPKHALTHCHLSFKEQFNTSKAPRLTFCAYTLR